VQGGARSLAPARIRGQTVRAVRSRAAAFGSRGGPALARFSGEEGSIPQKPGGFGGFSCKCKKNNSLDGRRAPSYRRKPSPYSRTGASYRCKGASYRRKPLSDRCTDGSDRRRPASDSGRGRSDRVCGASDRRRDGSDRCTTPFRQSERGKYRVKAGLLNVKVDISGVKVGVSCGFGTLYINLRG
jgi:hypothetical protein